MKAFGSDISATNYVYLDENNDYIIIPIKDAVDNNIINNYMNTLDILQNYPTNNIWYIKKLVECNCIIMTEYDIINDDNILEANDEIEFMEYVIKNILFLRKEHKEDIFNNDRIYAYNNPFYLIINRSVLKNIWQT